jgi:hypothetical protein
MAGAEIVVVDWAFTVEGSAVDKNVRKITSTKAKVLAKLPILTVGIGLQ